MAVAKAKQLRHPFSLTSVRSLRLGDRVLVSGLVATGRDRLHRHLYDSGTCPVDLHNGAIYHCGPSVVRNNGQWILKAAGPTTSIREEPYMPKIIAKHGLRVIIGKGGMGPDTQKACREHGCVYLNAVGGAAQILAASVREIRNVHFLKEFGPAEACWEFVIQDLPAVVTIDARGRSLHKKIADLSRRNLKKLLTRKF